jgi:hypothetical protein
VSSCFTRQTAAALGDSALEHCFGNLGPPEIARARVAQARASLETQRKHASTASVRQQCVTGLAQMTCR